MQSGSGSVPIPDVKMDTMSTDPTRRHLLFGLFLSAALVTLAPAAHADGGDDGGGDDGGGNSGHGGGGNSGHGGGDDDDDDDDNDENSSGSGNEHQSESQRARDAVKDKKAVPLRVLMTHLNRNYPGKVLDVDLKRSRLNYNYHVKILSKSGKVQRIRLNALTLQKI